MIILGIDPGFGRMGTGIIEKTEGKLHLLHAGLIETDPSLPHHERLCKIYNELTALIRAHKPVILSIERLFFTKNQKTLIPVAEARGIALLTAGIAGLTVYEYAPPEVKCAITGNGKADKKAMQKMVALTLKTAENFVDDTTDAIALAITAAYDRKNNFSAVEEKNKN